MAGNDHGNIVGRNIRRRRKALGMSSIKLALAVGFSSDSGVGNIEAGKDTTTSRLYKIADALGCSVAELFAEPQILIKVSVNGEPFQASAEVEEFIAQEWEKRQ